MAIQLTLSFAFGLLGNLVSFITFLAPLPTFYQIYKRKSTDGFQSIPYIVALLSASLIIYYGMIKMDPLLITINAIGCIIESLYIIAYLCYAPKQARILTVKLVLLMNVLGYGLVISLTMFQAQGPRRQAVVGWICMAFSLCVFAAPLCIVRKVIETKSVEYMPFELSLFLTVGAVVWFFYGFLKKDYYIAVPNLLGFAFGVLQMVLYGIYKNKKGSGIGKDEDAGNKQQQQLKKKGEREDVEMVGVDVVKLMVCPIPLGAAAAGAAGQPNTISNTNVMIKPKETEDEIAVIVVNNPPPL